MICMIYDLSIPVEVVDVDAEVAAPLLQAHRDLHIHTYTYIFNISYIYIYIYQIARHSATFNSYSRHSKGQPNHIVSMR
jgi:hypothetical protein